MTQILMIAKQAGRGESGADSRKENERVEEP